MKRINLDLFELQAFLRLAECGSFRQAAEKAGLSGPALSRLIQRIESRFEARLFDRDTRNVALTPAGAALRVLAGRVLAEAETALDAFTTYLDARRGRVTIAGLPSVTAGLLPPLIARFAAAYPDVDLNILDALSGGVAEAVRSGQADLGFAAGGLDTGGGLIFKPLTQDAFVGVARRGGPLSEERDYTWDELMTLPFVAMAQGTSVRALTDGAMAQAGIALSPRFEVSHLATAGALVAEGLGVTALPAFCLPVLGGAALESRPLKDPAVVRKIGVVRAAGRTPSPAAAAFHDFLLASVRGMRMG